MATLIQKLRVDALQARKDAIKGSDVCAQVASTLLVTLVSEAAMVGKNDGGREPTDDEVVKVLKKFVKGVDDTLDVLSKAAPEGDARIVQLRIEKDVLAGYLPQQLSAEVLAAEIQRIVAALPEKGPKQMGAVMKALKDGFGGRYDGALAGRLVKEALA